MNLLPDQYIDMHGDDPARDDAEADAIAQGEVCGRDALLNEDGPCRECAKTEAES